MAVRHWVQTLFFFLTNGYWNFPVTRSLYKGPLKLVCSPGLNCFSCPAATTYCPLGALQQLFAGIRLSWQTGQIHVGLYVLGAMGAMGGLFGRMICGWACPFGLLQDLLHKIPSPKFGIPNGLRYVKYLLLAFMVVILPLVVVDVSGNGQTWFCKYICPAGTLEAGLPMLALRPSLRAGLGWIFVLKISILVGVLTASVFTSRPFCRVGCPLGAFYALFNRSRLVRLSLDNAKCTDCGGCRSVCPMGLQFNQSPNDRECISCLACRKHCPSKAVGLEVGGWKIGEKGQGGAAEESPRPV